MEMVTRSLLVLALLVSLLATGSKSCPAAPCVAPPPGMVSWWGGDNNALDIIGTNSGSPENGATYAPGMVEQAFSLDGADDYVQTPAVAGGLAEGTIDFWVKFDAIKTNNEPFGSENDAIAFFNFAGISGGVFTFGLQPAGWNFASSSVVPVAGEWYHLAGTWGPAGMKIYVNGVLSGSDPYTGPAPPTAYHLLGDSIHHNGAAIDGLLDEVEVFNRALTDTEIAAIYGAGNAGKCRPCRAQPSGLLSWWRGESNGADSVDGNEAALLNGTTFAVGKAGHGFSLDGTDDYLQVQSPTGLPAGGAARTMDLWFKTSRNLSSATESALIQYGSTNGGQMFGLIFSGNCPGKLYFYGHSSDLCGTTTVQPDTWYHGAVTYDGTTLSLYLNGRLENSATMTLDTVLDGNGLTIGNRPGSSLWQGELDEVEIFNRALGADEITAIANAGRAVTCPTGLVSEWQAEGDATDSTGLHHGTPQGGVAFVSGRYGQGFSLDGVDDYIDLGSWFAYQSFAVEMWVNPGASQGSYANIIDNNHRAGLSWVVQQNLDVQNEYEWGTSDGGNGTFTLPANQWTHLVLTRDGTTRAKTLYMNGVAVSSTTGTGDIPYDGSQFLRLGKWGGTCCSYIGRYWSGRMDNVRVYNRSLTASEVSNLYGGPDQTPDAFAFPDQMDVALSTEVTSDFIIVSGINSETGISITGGEYRINAGGWATGSATVRNGDKVTVRQTSSDTPATTTEATLTIGDVSDTFSVTTAPPFATAGLQLWLRADAGVSRDGGDQVSAWEEQRGNGLDLTQGSGEKQPLAVDNAVNGLPVLRFDGIDDYLQTAAAVNLLQGSADFSLFVVTKPSVFQKDWADILDYTHSSYVNIVLQQEGNAANSFQCGGVVQQLYPTSYQVFTGVYDNGVVSRSYLNGGNGRTGTPPLISLNEPNYLTVGSKSLESFPRQFSGDIAEIILYNTALGDAEREAVEGYLLAKYGLDITPDPFAFADQSGVAPDTVVTSGSVFVTGVNSPASIAISGCSSTACEYSLDNLIWTADPGMVTDGAMVFVRQTASGAYGTPTHLTLDIGGVSDIFTLTTINTYTVSASAGAGGSLDAATPSPQTVVAGDTVDFTFNADTGYHLTSISGCGITIENDTVKSRTITTAPITEACTVTATFAIDRFVVNAFAGAGGSVDAGTPWSQVVDYGATAQFTFNANTGYHVASISGCGISYSNSDNSVSSRSETTATVTADCTVNATFAINTYTLTYTAGANGSISGTTPQTVNHGASGTAVTPVPNTGYHFVNWSDGSTANPRTDTNVTANITVTANFAINTYTLTYTAGANGSITGTSPQTVNHGASGTAVTPVPTTGYHFVDWSDGSTANPRLDTNVTANITVTANFALDHYTLAVILAGNGQGTVTSNPAGIDCGTTCGSSYDYGTAVTLTATPGAGSRFSAWSGDADCEDGAVVMTSDLACTATFSPDFPWLMFNHLFVGARP